MNFLIKADYVLRNIILLEIKRALIQKWIDSELSIKNFFTTKRKYRGDEVRDFYEKKIPKMDTYHACLSVGYWILL